MSNGPGGLNHNFRGGFNQHPGDQGFQEVFVEHHSIAAGGDRRSYSDGANANANSAFPPMNGQVLLNYNFTPKNLKIFKPKY